MPSLVDVAALNEWIGDRLPCRGVPLRATRMGEGTGEANALYWLRRSETGNGCSGCSPTAPATCISRG